MSEIVEKEVNFELEKITIEIPKNALAISMVTIYEKEGSLLMFPKVYTTSDLKSLKGADNNIE